MRNIFTNVLLLQSENVQGSYVVTHLTSSYFNAEISTRLLDENRNFEYIYHLDTPCHTRFLPYCLIFLKVLHKYSANKYTIKYTTDFPRFSHRCTSFSFNRFTLHFPPNEVFYVAWGSGSGHSLPIVLQVTVHLPSAGLGDTALFTCLPQQSLAPRTRLLTTDPATSSGRWLITQQETTVVIPVLAFLFEMS